MIPILKDLLIVEDNTYIRKNIVNALKNNFGEENICQSATLQNATSLLKETNFKSVILDLALPDGNGVEMLKVLKKQEVKSRVYVFSMNIELKQLCLKYGATAFFDKTKDFDKLIESILKPN